MGYTSESTTMLTSAGECRAGLCCMGRQFHAIGICPEGIYVDANGEQVVVKRGKFARLFFRVTNDSKNNLHQFYYSTDGKHYVAAGDAFSMRSGFWKGIRVALFCYGENGKAQFDFFRMDYR